MHGFVFDQLRAFADSLAPGVWKVLLGEASISRDIYLVSEPYPDEELEAGGGREAVIPLSSA